MALVLFLIFIVVPIAEIAVFIEAGRLIGLVPTIAITIGTAIAGSFLMRIQGFATLNRFAQSLEKGEMPLTPVIDGIGILAAGLLLLTPGLLTDTIGFLLFVPHIRRGLARWAFQKALRSGHVHIRTMGRGDAGGPPPGFRPRGGGTFKKSDNVVDAEFETVDPSENGGGSHAAPADGKRNGNSPWRKD